MFKFLKSFPGAQKVLGAISSTRDSETFKATLRNAEVYEAFIRDTRATYAEKFEAAMHIAENFDADARPSLITVLEGALDARKRLGLYGFDLFPARRLRQVLTWSRRAVPHRVSAVGKLLRQRQAAQQVLLQGQMSDSNRVETARVLRRLDSEIALIVASRVENGVIRVNNRAMVTLTKVLASAVGPVGLGFEWLSERMKRANGILQGGKLVRGMGWVIGAFLSRESLYRTGFETSWGFRAIIPGTEGFLGNVGPWVMFYSGSLRDYTSMAVPFRVNPGFTIATDIGTITQNRPGFGAGTATPLVSGYVDKARSKFLLGRDGVIYIRVGEWEGRGPYFTISAFIPLTSVIRITWNFSIFNPGWAPLVEWSKPLTLWVRAQSDWLWDKIKKPFVWMRTKKG